MSRADKKTQVAPYLPFERYSLVRKLSLHMDTEIGEAGKMLVFASLHSWTSLSRLSPYFARTYGIGNKTFPGHRSHKVLKDFINEYVQGTDRLYMRFTKDETMKLDDLAVAFGRAPLAHTAAALLFVADRETILNLAPGFEKWTPMWRS